MKKEERQGGRMLSAGGRRMDVKTNTEEEETLEV